MKRTSGTSLVEIMVAGALLLLITGACAQALRASAQYFKRIESLTEMENQLTALLGRLTHEVGETSPTSIHWVATPPALTFASPRNNVGQLQVDHPAGGNTLLFSSMIHYSVDPVSRDLRRYVDVMPPVSRAPHPINELVPVRDAAYFSQPTINSKVLAQGATTFELQAYEIDGYTSAQTLVTDLRRADLLKMEIKLERDFGRIYAIESQLELTPRN